MKGGGFGLYHLSHQIGSGGMGDVHLGFGPTLAGDDDDLVVIKTIKREYLEHNELVVRFEDEARTLSMLVHPHIARLFDAGTVDGSAFMAIEHVDGLTLRQVLARVGALPFPIALHTASSLLEALDCAHSVADARGRVLGVVHRDVSPQNVMIGFSGDVKLIDFGIARSRQNAARTLPGRFLGKKRYAAPEQMIGDVVTAQSDVFAAGIVITELLAGERFYGDLSDDDVARAVFSQQFQSPALQRLPAPLQHVMTQATQFPAQDRYASAHDMLHDFQAAMSSVSGQVSSPKDDLKRLLEVRFAAEVMIARREAMQVRAAGIAYFHERRSSSSSLISANEKTSISAATTQTDKDNAESPEASAPAIATATLVKPDAYEPAPTIVMRAEATHKPTSTIAVEDVSEALPQKRWLRPVAAAAVLVVAIAGIVMMRDARIAPPTEAVVAPAVPETNMASVVPVVDTPVVDTPVVDTPVVDTPVVDQPVVDKPLRRPQKTPLVEKPLAPLSPLAEKVAAARRCASPACASLPAPADVAALNTADLVQLKAALRTCQASCP
jgi:eukaryotic-like serine/threonine-protein kinase